MITNVLVFITVIVSITAFQRTDVFSKLLFNAYAVKHNKQWERFFSYALVHADWPHLILNMIAFWSFGHALEDYYFVDLFGRRADQYFILLYIGGAAAACIPSYLKHKDNSHYNSVGASGAVSAVVFSCILIDPLQPIAFMFAIQLPGIVFGILYLAYSWYMDKKAVDNIGHDAHFWGAVYGMAFTILLEPRIVQVFFQRILMIF